MPRSFRDFLRRQDDPRITGLATRSAEEHAEHCLARPPIAALVDGWRALHAQPFRGITCDGHCRQGLFPAGDEAAPTRAAAGAARELLALLDEASRAALCRPADAIEWRAWMNPEIYLHRHGLRLDQQGDGVRAAALELLRTSLSDAGFRRVRNLMRINHFLGELVQAPRVLNEYSYNLALFGAPSLREPWGWQFHGHHIALNVRFAGGQMVATPVFFGAEPHGIDQGPWAGVREFDAEERLALALMDSLDVAQRGRAVLYAAKRDAAMQRGRIAFADELMLAGAFQDNRVVPHEGLRCDTLGPTQRRALLELVGAYLAYLPVAVQSARIAAVERHLAETHFCWIGGTAEDDPFYYRLQNPVLLAEFDHHAGVFLGNAEPERFHVHTVLRTPNGGDYGMAMVKRWCEGQDVISGSRG